ncbi:Piso0_001194 [Millerozyma farinosa CBS 7064]|uniref:Piso0_001194 protein n=1 Tax=Pichia sorbitophila (strain ATCC MYA-4447 / BCRC 22081 / CBS 7064 / NBRC 10061 / NRRL Y-12695) TaxID=559304 RepID=G8YSN0_PICSO|nr:Piso0_001194 [Millerozyma farinosa CBS 7064]CCE79153.1 Piso0_001194 [Millerozyma farinosa CBS 7064]
MSNSTDESSSKLVKDERKKLVWIDHSVEDFSKDDDSRSNTGDSSSGEVDEIRRRIEKRKKRHYYQSRNLNTLNQHDKRARNTLAARKYRERRQKELDVLDKRVKALENELESAKLEAKWWKMEASRWQAYAKNSEESFSNPS